MTTSTAWRRRPPLAGRLDPADSLPEILVGLVMVIGITSTARLDVIDTEAGVQNLLIAAFATTLAWAIIDGGLYLLAAGYDAGRWNLMTRRLRAASGAADEAARRAEAVRRLTGGVADARLDPADAEAVYAAVARAAERSPAPARLTGQDALAALAVAGVVLASTFPPVVPFLFPLEPDLALGLSNALGVLSLFAVGVLLSASTTVSRVALGLVLAVGGCAMVAVTVLLDVN
jgi:VIT1/CCC1 family predicted Fe2+/Mn2+ transporter